MIRINTFFVLICLLYYFIDKDISLERENPLIVVYRRIERYINTFIEDDNMKEKVKKLLTQFDIFKEERLQISHLWEAQVLYIFYLLLLYIYIYIL